MTTTPTTPVALADALGSFTDQWSPRIVTTINDYDVRVAKVHGEHVWHTHDNTDEFFLVLDGELHIALREGACERTVVLAKGAVFTVPRGIRHRPSAPVPTEILVLEPSGTSTVGDRHDAVPDHIDVTTGHLLVTRQGDTASATGTTHSPDQ
jgi:mannose-6-phosphate isomerase-like protein (cupin superfamily)